VAESTSSARWLSSAMAVKKLPVAGVGLTAFANVRASASALSVVVASLALLALIAKSTS
jgi:hypothetical protein